MKLHPCRLGTDRLDERRPVSAEREGSKNFMLEVCGSFAGTEICRRSRWDERFAGRFE